MERIFRKREGVVEDSRPTYFLGSLLAEYKKSLDTFTVNDVYYHIILNMLIGGETTAATLTAALYFLCKLPGVL